jgi:hypothetical protein
MRVARLLPSVIVLLSLGCDAGGSTREAPTSRHTDWRTTGPFAAKRKALKTAVETFPTNASSLARCKPGQGSVLTLGYNTARQLYAPNAPSAPKVGVASDIDVASRRFDLEQIEKAAWETTPIEYMDKWSKPPFPWVNAVALFRAESVKPPESGLCAGSQCEIVLGIVEGDIVVFDDDGKPTCANRLRIEGPSSALVKVGDKLEDLQRMGVESILQGYFYYATETIPDPAPWRFLQTHQSGPSPTGCYSISIDGERVQTASCKL